MKHCSGTWLKYIRTTQTDVTKNHSVVLTAPDSHSSSGAITQTVTEVFHQYLSASSDWITEKRYEDPSAVMFNVLLSRKDVWTCGSVPSFRKNIQPSSSVISVARDLLM